MSISLPHNIFNWSKARSFPKNILVTSATAKLLKSHFEVFHIPPHHAKKVTLIWHVPTRIKNHAFHPH